ncbi:MAG: hemolysin III family protein [Bacteroidales bacterium]|nr:hemolysin III family protein [Bacteroidales bacterium]
MEKYIPPYSEKEEKINVLTHGLGLLLSIPALILLVVYSSLYGNVWHVISFSIYGSTLVLLYLASTLYHAAKSPEIKAKLNIFDHSAIYLLIAGTYTPFLLVTIRGPWGWSLFGIVWGLAIIGILMKFFFTSRYKVVSALAYILMGWVIIIAIKPLINNLSTPGLWWLFAGGLSYTIGAVLYTLKKLPYHHAIFHVFVLGGSFAHWVAVFYYVW